MSINWYFHRDALAKRLADGFSDLGKERIALFANRQKGKTLFSIKDLIPLMEKKGFFCIYVDFWSNKDDPALAFATGVAESFEQLTLLKKPLTIKAFKLTSISNSPIGAELGIEFEKPESYSDNEADNAIQYLLKFAKHKPIFLVLDEIQHLATSKQFEIFTAKLRSFLINKAQRSQHPIKALFIGSDQARLSGLFKSSKAPFYRATDVEDFPELGKDFVNYTLGNYQTRMGNITLDKEEAYQLFVDGGKMPGAFTDLVRAMVAEGREDLLTASKDFDYFGNAEELYKQQLSKLNPQDIAVLALLANGYEKIFTEKNLSIIANIAGKESVSKSSAQGTIKKLSRRGVVITKGHGVWELADSAMSEWIKHNSTSIRQYL